MPKYRCQNKRTNEDFQLVCQLTRYDIDVMKLIRFPAKTDHKFGGVRLGNQCLVHLSPKTKRIGKIYPCSYVKRFPLLFF